MELCLNVAVEHRLMHAETLAYLMHGLPLESKIVPRSALQPDSAPPPRPGQVTVPAGVATLGQVRHVEAFGWDNEFDSEQVAVPSFSIDVFPVTNLEYLKFVHAGGYEKRFVLAFGRLGMEVPARSCTSPFLDAQLECSFHGF